MSRSTCATEGPPESMSSPSIAAPMAASGCFICTTHTIPLGELDVRSSTPCANNPAELHKHITRSAVAEGINPMAGTLRATAAELRESIDPSRAEQSTQEKSTRLPSAMAS
eukprot:1124551-Prorocentrum_minimum.AAC.3